MKKAEIKEALEWCSRPLLVSHYNPDADALGSILGLGLILNSLGKESVIFNRDGVESRFEFIPSSSLIQNGKIPEVDYDLIVICDCGEFKRIGEDIVPELKKDVPIVNIDHHSSNSMFGSLNLVDVSYTSTCELIADIAREFGWEITSDAAVALYSGILTDSGSFKYDKVSSRTFQLASFLVERGVNPNFVAKSLFSSRPISEVRLHSKAISEAKCFFDSKLMISVVTREDFESCGALLEEADGIVEQLRDIQGVEIGVAVREADDIWRISLRSHTVDVSDIAKSFGGGGHVLAAAFRSKVHPDEFLEKLIERCGQALGYSSIEKS